MTIHSVVLGFLQRLGSAQTLAAGSEVSTAVQMNEWANRRSDPPCHPLVAKSESRHIRKPSSAWMRPSATIIVFDR
jgi:hypothetical protein